MAITPLYAVQHLWVLATCLLFSPFFFFCFHFRFYYCHFVVNEKAQSVPDEIPTDSMQILSRLDLVNAWPGVSFSKDLNDLRVFTKVTLSLLSLRSPKQGIVPII